MSRKLLLAKIWFTLIDKYAFCVIIIKRGRQCKARSDSHPISLKTPAPHYQPIDRKKRKGKKVEDEKGLSSLGQ